MPLRFGHAGDFHLDEDRYFADTAQCLDCLWRVPSGRNDPGNATVDLRSAIHDMRQGERVRYERLFRDETVGALPQPTPRSSCACCAGPCTLGGFTKSALSTTRHSFGKWRIEP